MKRILVIRLSSLGDVLLSTAFLENLPSEVVVDWVVAAEFEFVLKGHPRIRNLISFQKKTGLSGWLELIKKLHQESYDLHVDLHGTLRSRLARWYWSFLSWKQGRRGPETAVISKDRSRFYGYTLFKRWLPTPLRPVPYWIRYAKMSQKLFSKTASIQVNPPSFLPVLQQAGLNEAEVLQRYGLEEKRYYAIMPASRWKSKEWSPEKYADLCAELNSQTQILLVGRSNEPACKVLVALLKRKNISFRSALDEPNFSVTAILLRRAVAFVGGDTGLAHLSESVGTKAVVIFGPTRPDLGFGPRREDSVSVFSNTWCSPCSKDGKICYRFYGRYACLSRITVEQVKEAAKA